VLPGLTGEEDGAGKDVAEARNAETRRSGQMESMFAAMDAN